MSGNRALKAWWEAAGLPALDRRADGGPPRCGLPSPPPSPSLCLSPPLYTSLSLSLPLYTSLSLSVPLYDTSLPLSISLSLSPFSPSCIL